jgi:hypothetical protein
MAWQRQEKLALHNRWEGMSCLHRWWRHDLATGGNAILRAMATWSSKRCPLEALRLDTPCAHHPRPNTTTSRLRWVLNPQIGLVFAWKAKLDPSLTRQCSGICIYDSLSRTLGCCSVMLDASFLFDKIPKPFTVLTVDYMLIRKKIDRSNTTKNPMVYDGRFSSRIIKISS